ncbi:MAG: daunorubicin resistance transporter ATPase subunit [Holophagaceae bacterium]|nr:daunorubicin resistance transporter ATPase subunit [Holophagaceae bacterium]
MIILEDLVKRFGEITAVDHLSLHLEKGKIHGLLGPNGAGKTTLVRMMSTLTRPTAGKAFVAGCNVERDPMGVKRSIGVVHQTLNFDPELTAREALVVHGHLHGMPKARMEKRVQEMLAFAGLEKEANRMVPTFSGGMKRRLSIARAMLHDPEVILMDEPSVGLDAHARRKVWDLVRKLREAGRTLILTTHYMEEAQALSDRVIIVDHGKVIADGNPEGLISEAGRVAVDHPGHAGTLTKFFENREEAAQFLASLDEPATVRAANLEDVFLKLTGRHVNPKEQEGVAANASRHGHSAARKHHS